MSKRKSTKPSQKQAFRKRGQEPALSRQTSGSGGPVATGPAWVGLLAAALGVVLYMNTFGHIYCLDDYSVIKENWVTQGGLKNLGTMFSTEYRYGAWNSPGSLYRPFSLLIFSLQWQLSPDNPAVGHIMNAIMYGLSGWVLWITWRRVLAGYHPIIPALAVLFFMAHPVHTEVVANIKSLDEILALLCCTASLYGIWRYLERENKNWLVMAVAMYTVALFSKESSITFLAIFPLTLWFFTDRPLGQIVRIAALFLAPAVIFLLIRHQVLAAQAYEERYSALDNFIVAAKDRASQLASAFMMCGRYLKTLVLPHPLVSDLGYPQMKPVTFGDWRALVGFFTYGGMFVWALLNLRKKHFLAFAILFYLVTFSLFSNVLMLIGTSYGERVLYAPSLGFTLALAWIFAAVFKLKKEENTPATVQLRNPNGKGALVWGLAGIVLLGYGVKTVLRNPAWYTSYTLYKADISKSPNCAKLNYHMGIETIKEGMNEDTGQITDTTWVNKAIDYYSHAIELFPTYHDAFGSRGLAYFRLGQHFQGQNNLNQAAAKYDLAYTDYQRALKHRPNDDKVLSNMGFIYFIRQQLDSAEVVYRKSIAINPRFIDARRNLGAVLAMKKQFPEAIEQWQEGLKYEPENPTLLQYIGSAYNDMGQPEKAQPWLERAAAAQKK